MDTMVRKKIQDVLLTLFGAAALLVYVLACRPSFSPDGSKVVFPVKGNGQQAASVALYDLKEKKLKTIFVSPRQPKEEDQYLTVQWLPDGKQVLVNGVSFIAILPLGSSNPTRFIPLEEKLDAGVLVIPPPVIGKYQFMVHEASVEEKDANGHPVDVKKPFLLRANLETAEIQKVIQGNEETNFVAKGSQLYYFAKSKAGADDIYELGRLDAEKLSRNRILQLKEKEFGEFIGFMTPNSNGTRFALTVKLEKALRILLVRGNALEKWIPVKQEGIDIGNVEWSPDERTLYLAFAKDLTKDNLWQYGILEVPVNGGSTRDIPLFTGEKREDNPTFIFQIALSADGRRIAATSACLEGIRPENNALYLVDLHSSKRNVTKVAIPLPAGSGMVARQE